MRCGLGAPAYYMPHGAMPMAPGGMAMGMVPAVAAAAHGPQMGQGVPQAPNMSPESGFGKPHLGTRISKSVSTIQKVPKCHQVDGIQHVDASIDSTLSGKCDQDELAVIVWLLTRIKPDFKVSDLRCDYYEQIFEKYQCAGKRIKERREFIFLHWLTHNLLKIRDSPARAQEVHKNMQT